MSTLLLYPSGKGAVRSEITQALSIAANHDRLPYREPFLGGGTMTLHTLDFARADSLWLNDKDASLMCFWTAVIECPKLLLAHVDSFTPSVEAWHIAKRECRKLCGMPSTPDRIAELGFHKLVVQRLSRSGRGVRSGSVRGGSHKSGPIYKDINPLRTNRIDRRWSPQDIRRNVLRYHHKFMRVDELRYTNLDFASVIQDESERCILFLDPPYWQEGPGTYQYSFTRSDHKRLAALLQQTEHAWVLTYGNHEEIRRLYEWAKIETIRVESSLTNQYRTDLIITGTSTRYKR
jgi:DNA adenine methylase